VYGPNTNDKTFYNSLSSYIDTLGDVPVVIGGDWNATYSQAQSCNNLDVINMVSPPSIIRSGWLADVCEAHNLLDPYRAFHPTRREFSFFPHGARKNRSRIDFFLISEALLNSCRSCEISPWLSISNFDHKSVNLDFTREKKSTKLYINRTIISNPRTDDVVLGAFADTYLAHADPEQTVVDDHVHHLRPARAIELQKGIVGNFLRLLREANNLSEREVLEPENNLIPLLLAGILAEINLQRELIWNICR
jgi:hypothetical protein